MLVQIDYELQFHAPFHLGTGIAAASVDRTVIRDAGGALYVPASTFKGGLREHCEQLCRFYLPHLPIASPHDAYATLAQFGKAPTPISRIFGSPLYPGTLRFNDARQTEETYTLFQDMQTSILTQVRINRLTRTAVDEALFSSEFGLQALRFAGTIKGQLNCTPVEKLTETVQAEESDVPKPTYSLLVLLAGLLMIERIGGNKSTGKGQCNCAIQQVVLDGQPCAEQRWRSWIGQLEVLQNYPVDERGGQA